MWFIAKLPQMTGLFKAPSVFCLCKTESISLHSFAKIQLGLEHGKKVMCVRRDSHSDSPRKSEFADWFTHFIAGNEEHWLLFQGLRVGSQHPHGAHNVYNSTFRWSIALFWPLLVLHSCAQTHTFSLVLSIIHTHTKPCDQITFLNLQNMITCHQLIFYVFSIHLCVCMFVYMCACVYTGICACICTSVDVKRQPPLSFLRNYPPFGETVSLTDLEIAQQGRLTRSDIH